MATTPKYKPQIIEGIRKPMGCFNVLIEVGDPQGSRFELIEALVDTGTFYTVVPAATLRQLGVTPSERVLFELADDRQVEYDIGETTVRLGNRIKTTTVVFGETITKPLLGALTLEEFRLWVDPVKQQLIEMPPFKARPF